MDTESDDQLNPGCTRFRGELGALLYGELPPDARTVLEAHLAGCAACGEELAALGETRRLLARWQTPGASEDPRELARTIAAQARAGTPARGPRRARLVRLGALLSGAAAALLFTLSVLGARASLASGRFELSFALPGAAPAAVPVPLEEQLRAFAAQEVAARVASLEQSQEQWIARLSQLTQQELLRLAQAVDDALDQNQRTFDTRFTTLTREAQRADLETRRALTEFASYLPVNQPNR